MFKFPSYAMFDEICMVGGLCDYDYVLVYFIHKQFDKQFDGEGKSEERDLR